MEIFLRKKEKPVCQSTWKFFPVWAEPAIMEERLGLGRTLSFVQSSFPVHEKIPMQSVPIIEAAICYRTNELNNPPRRVFN
ncbi:MAG: hypothetical protein D6830_06720 [Ignavibacteria bacterium]|nr:MAG: hypothetical protein D6830_06720 [Ignavibacteria bacterium]